jgi:Family of unknown function (DUF5703)
MNSMGEYEYQHLYLPRGTSRGAARRVLTDHAEYGHWELARLRLFPDGSRRVVLRRRVIKAIRTA